MAAAAGLVKLLPWLAAGGIAWVMLDDGDDNPPLTPGAHDAVFYFREVDGQLVRFFRPDMAGVSFQVLHNSQLVPITPPPELSGQAVFRPQPGSGAPQQITSAVAQGVMALGSLMLPFPTKQGRLVALASRNMLHVANANSEWGVLLYGPEGTPLPGKPVGGGPGPGGGDEGADIVLTPPVTRGGDQLDADLPAKVRAKVEGMLDDPDIDPWALDDAADVMDDNGYPLTAKALRARAKERRAEWAADDMARGWSEHTIRLGDLAYNMAQHYTGQGARWTEIPKLDPRISIKNGQPSPWNGTVRIPLDWEIWKKRPPPVATGSLPSEADDLDDMMDDDVDPQEVADNIVSIAKNFGSGLKPAGGRA